MSRTIRKCDIRLQVSKWLHQFLSDRYKNASVMVLDSSRTKLSKILFNQGLSKYFPYYKSFDFQPDITGIVEFNNTIALALVEIENKTITLRDIGPFVEYCKIVAPQYALFLTPFGISDSLHQLLKTFGKYDLLEYVKYRRVIIANWDPSKRDLDYFSILPPGELR